MIKYIIIGLLLTQLGLSAGPSLEKHVVPLYGNATLGYYYANIFVGEPPQQQSVIADTGSGLLALPCSKCTHCGYKHLNVPFKVEASKSTKYVTCNSKEEVCRKSCSGKRGEDACSFSISYAEGSSLHGIYLEDQIQFEGDSKGEGVGATFGCTTRETNLFYTQAANGIFGLAPERQARLLEKLHQKHAPSTGQELLFSLCLSHDGGQLVIGRTKPELHRSKEPVTTTFSTDRNLYSLNHIGEFRLGKDVIRSKNDYAGYYGIFIDSGSTFSYLPSTNFKYLMRSLQNACSKYPDQCLISKGTSNCFKVKRRDDSSLIQMITEIFPSLDIEINGEVVGWEPLRYFTVESVQSSKVCLGVFSLDRFILGANWMVDRDVVFNLQKKVVEIFSGAECQVHKKEVMAVYPSPPKPQQYTFPSYKELEKGEFGFLLVMILMIVVVFMILLIVIGKYTNQKPKVRQQPEEDEERLKISSKKSDKAIHFLKATENDQSSPPIQTIVLSQQSVPQ